MTLLQNPAAWLSLGLARGFTEALRFFYRLAGVDVEPKAICLNSVCALPVSTLPIDSAIVQRTFVLGARVLVWGLLAAAILVVVQAVIRAVLAPGTRTVLLLRRVVTVRTVLIALGCSVVLAAGVAVLGNLRFLRGVAAPYSGMEWATME
jgi:hypothetical protein